MSVHATVEQAKRLADENRALAVVVFTVTRNGTFGYASYGHTRKACGKAKKLADLMFDAATAKLRDRDEWPM